MGLFDWLKPPPALDKATLEHIELAVTPVDPLIKQIRGYEHKLAPAVQHAYNYCESLAKAIPGPFPISRAAFANDPLVHALFGSADGVETMLATSQCVRDYLEGHSAVPPGQCCALLGMRRRITAGFGTRMEGELIKRDEPRKTLTFADHTLAEPSPDLQVARKRLTERMFSGLIKGFVAHVDEVREDRQELRDAQAMERARARASGPEAHTRRIEELQERLRETGNALQPEYLLETLAAYLAEPETALHLEPLQFWVDRFGIIAEDEVGRSHADKLKFSELTIRDLRRWVAMIVSIDREEARAALDHLEERRRYIVI